jgi:hypothetical protein
MLRMAVTLMEMVVKIEITTVLVEIVNTHILTGIMITAIAGNIIAWRILRENVDYSMTSTVLQVV